MRRVIESLFTLTLLSIMAAAQAPVPTAKMPSPAGDANRNQVFVGFVYQPTDWGPAWDKFYGIDVNYTRDVWRHFAGVLDFDWTKNDGSNPLDIDRGVHHNATTWGLRAGPRYNLLGRKHRVQPYLTALFGGDHLSALVPFPAHVSPTLVQKDWFGFTWAVGGGVDLRLTRRFGVRGEWLHEQVPFGTEKIDQSNWDRISVGGTFRW